MRFSSFPPCSSHCTVGFKHEILMEDLVILLDGMIYLPEIKYRRVLNKAFGPGGWGLAPRSETNVGPKIVSREYALVCLGRYAPLFLPYHYPSLRMLNDSRFFMLMLMANVVSLPSPVANKNTSIPLASPPLQKPANPTRSCGVVKTWVLRASFGIRGS